MSGGKFVSKVLIILSVMMFSLGLAVYAEPVTSSKFSYDDFVKSRVAIIPNILQPETVEEE